MNPTDMLHLTVLAADPRPGREEYGICGQVLAAGPGGYVVAGNADRPAVLVDEVCRVRPFRELQASER